MNLNIDTTDLTLNLGDCSYQLGVGSSDDGTPILVLLGPIFVAQESFTAAVRAHAGRSKQEPKQAADALPPDALPPGEQPAQQQPQQQPQQKAVPHATGHQIAPAARASGSAKTK